MVLHVLQIWSPQVLAIAVMETFDMLNQVVHGGDLELVLTVASVLQTAQFSDRNKLPTTIAQSASVHEEVIRAYVHITWHVPRDSYWNDHSPLLPYYSAPCPKSWSLVAC